ncbi:MAG: amino acid adenylation domain-containing protein, partial [Acidobacteria bacterium]|nr:amino acid adenylation domain-containing protein [Acidobacteriota bacterium]
MPDIERFEESFKKLIKRHESLRTSFHMIEDQPVQKVHDKVEFKIEYKDLATDKLPQHGQTRTLTEVFGPTFFQKGGFVRPFDLSHAPLLRVGLIKEKGDRHFLMVDMHHIISDGVSHEVLVKEFLALQEGKVLPPLRLQYKDFAQWQNGSKEVDRLHQQMQYWLIEFEGEIPVLELPTDYPRPISQSFAGNNMDFEISSEDTRDLKAVALKCGATLFMVLAAAVNILLSKLSGQEEIIIGTPIAGRRHADLEKIIGMFVNTLALRNYPNGEQTFTEFLGDIKERTLLVFENQEYPFEALVDKLSLKRDVGRNPLFDVMFVLQNIDTRSTGEDEEIPLDYENMVQTAKFDLTFTAVDLSRKTLFSIQYCTKLFKKETIERFINYFKKIVSIVVKESNIRLSDIEIIPEEEKKQVLFDFNNIAAEYPKDKTIHQLFEGMIAWMHDCMDAPMHDCMDAWMDGEVARNVSITYRQLNEQSDRLAGLLIEKGVLPDTIVTIMMGRSIEMIIGIFGILKSGGAYLPIDPEYPQERIDYMLKDSNARILINKSEARISKYETNPNTPKINVPDNKFKDLMVLDFENLNFEFVSSFGFRISDLNSSNLAYVIYTSGTTGKPKGSLIEHRNVVRLLSNDKFQFDFSNSDVWTLFHSFCFDFSVWEMYGALLYGGKLIIVPQITARDTHGFLALLNKENVTVLNQTPSAFYCLIAETLSSSQQERKLYIKYIILGGEALDPLKLKNWHKKYPLTRFINMFGITETTVHVTYKEINNEEIDSNISNIGKPIPTLSVYILDKYLKPVPIGVAGELCVGGKGVCRGYLNRPELTEGKFIENPYKAGDRLYRSADVGRFLGNGDIEYLGRMDHQVKIRGYRIELGEIEHQLIKYPGLKDVVVINQEEKSEDKNLCAYFVSSEELVIPELREFLTRELPDYMIPSYFVQIEKIPLTVNGKVDRKALPAPGVKKSEGYEPPGNETEEKLVKIWSEILGIDKNLIGMNEIFF